MEDYLNWLIDISNAEDFRHLYETLIDIEFFYDLKEDKNAEEFGLMLRDQYIFIDHGHIDSDFKCTVLEVIIALSKICCNRRCHPAVPDRIRDFVELIFNNLDINEFDSSKRIRTVITKCLNRDYEANNKYSMFPSNEYDLKDVDLMYQLKLWLDY